MAKEVNVIIRKECLGEEDDHDHWSEQNDQTQLILQINLIFGFGILLLGLKAIRKNRESGKQEW